MCVRYRVGVHISFQFGKIRLEMYVKSCINIYFYKDNTNLKYNVKHLSITMDQLTVFINKLCAKVRFGVHISFQFLKKSLKKFIKEKQTEGQVKFNGHTQMHNLVQRDFVATKLPDIST